MGADGLTPKPQQSVTERHQKIFRMFIKRCHCLADSCCSFRKDAIESLSSAITARLSSVVAAG
jgi:hypothetical protein